MSLLEVGMAIVAAIAVLAMLYVVAWCLYDVFARATDIGALERALWVLVLVGFNVLGAGLYVWFGPGRLRWAGTQVTG